VSLAYYSYLARTIPKREIARALFVRARRTLRDLWGRPAKEIRGHQAKLHADPGRDLRVAAEFRFVSPNPDQREATAAILRQRWPDECAQLMQEAAAALRGELPLFGAMKDCRKQDGAGIDYHRDPLVPSKRYDPSMPGERVDLFQPGADAKVMWEVGRLQHLWRFAQARWLAEEPSERSAWARAWIDGVRQFRADNPAGYGVQWSCAMEVSARAMQIALTFAYIRDDAAADGAFIGQLHTLLAEHCAYIESHLEETGVIRTNHYAADLVGLTVVGALFPELRRPQSWAEMLWDEIPRQVRADGTHFESSTGYQRLCAELFLVAVLAAEAGNNPAPPEVLRAMAGLFRSLCALLKPSGEMPQIGDLDSCRGLPLVPRSALDCSFLAGLGAAALGEANLKTGACPPEVAWFLGSEGVRRFERLPAAREPGSAALRDAGLAVLRSGDAWLCLSAGPNGQGGTGGHAHNDKCSVELSKGGLDLIADRGTFVYARDPRERNARRGTAGHSTLQVDGLEQNRILPGRLFALPDTARARLVRVEERSGIQLATGEHFGYQRYGVVHRRIAALTARAAAFIDEVRGHGEHHFTLRWFVPHTDLITRPATEAECARLEAMHAQGLTFGYDTSRCIAVRSGGEDLALFAFGATLPWTLALSATDVSPGYAETAPATLIQLDFAGAAPARLFTAVLFLRGK